MRHRLRRQRLGLALALSSCHARPPRRCFTLALDAYAYGGDLPTIEFCVGAKVAKFIG